MEEIESALQEQNEDPADRDHDGLEFEIALDLLALGNTDPLKRHCRS